MLQQKTVTELNKGNGYPVYDTYEKALEAGILEALKLI
jgi:hypothetical protein